MLFSIKPWRRKIRPILIRDSHVKTSKTTLTPLSKQRAAALESPVSSLTPVEKEGQHLPKMTYEEQHPRPPTSRNTSHNSKQVGSQASANIIRNGSCLKTSKLYDPILPLPPLLALPAALHQEIIQYLINSNGPELANLRGANRYFYSNITFVDLRQHGLALIEGAFLKKADRLFQYLRVDDQLPCSLCLSLLPISSFHWKSRNKLLGSKQAHTRYCMDCGIKHWKFGSGNHIKVDNEGDDYRIVCPKFSFFSTSHPNLEAAVSTIDDGTSDGRTIVFTDEQTDRTQRA